MKKIVSCFISIILFIFSTTTVRVHANDGSKTTGQERNDVYKFAALSVLDTLKKAMPTAPAGWTVADETTIDSLPEPESDGANQLYRFTYQIHYKRIAGIKEEKKRLTEVYAESAERHGEEANSQIDDLLKQQTATSLALRKATKHKNQAEMQRLNDELEENGRKMRAIHAEVDDKISSDVDQYLLKDTEVLIDIAVNDERAEDVYGEPVTVAEAAFAFRREGERKGPVMWQEGKTVILYGDWQQIGTGAFRGHVLHGPQNQRVQTIKITITGAGKRVLELLNQMDRKAILSLM
ncbi:MAG TPA: hypothetical protein VEI57_11930 [Nitrospirota bacterium]|nr:hypothetical protein [Nitrospirota bacterium]